MSLKKNNSDEARPRIVNLDFLRGFFIILALDQHFSYYINVWYVDYFHDAMAITNTYSVHFAMIGKRIATNELNQWLAWAFTPWVSQVYLTLAAFNLARKDQESFSEEMPGKFKIYGLILIYFMVENFIVAPNTGQALSFYPIMLWMLVLTLVSVIYKFFGIRGVLVCLALSMLRFVIPIELLSDFFEELVQNKIHPGFEYDARFEYFIISGLFGFIMGYVHYHMPHYRHNKDFLFGGLGLLLVLMWVIIGDSFHIIPDDVFITEHDLARTFTGTAFITGMQAMVFSAFLWLEKKNIKFNIALINWVGAYSLLIFALHRILFVKIIGPLSILFGSMTGRTMQAGVIETAIYIAAALGFCYFVKKSSIGDLILQNKK